MLLLVAFHKEVFWGPDLVESCEPYAEFYLFANDAELFRHILNSDNNCSRQTAVDCLQDLSQNSN